MNLTMYMVNAPLIGYMTANSASACIIRYLKTIVRLVDGWLRVCEFVHHNTYYEPISSQGQKSGSLALTNNHETK